MSHLIPSILPGRLYIDRGTPQDYRALERFHYRPRRPATWAAVWVVRYEETHLEGARDDKKHAGAERRELRDQSAAPDCSQSMPQNVTPALPRVVAVAVLSYPTVNSTARDRALALANLPAKRKLAFVNRHVRTISRVVVHPQFRSLGLASRLVSCVCAHCPTRFVEAFAVMGRVHPFFEKGGMPRQEPPVAEGQPDLAPVYYLFDSRTMQK